MQPSIPPSSAHAMFYRSNLSNLSGTFTQHNISYGSAAGQGFEILTKATTPSAFYDYGHQFDVPRCHENTRVAVLEKIEDWVNLIIEISAFIMWIYGAAGAGKSAIAHTMAEILHDRQQLLATFFFSRADSSRNHIKSVIATLAYKISLTIPEARPLIVATIENDPLIFHSTFAHQLEQLILGPVHRVSQQGVIYPMVIVIDGLDECLNHEERTILLQAISQAAGLHSTLLKFLITSRPEVPIARVFNATPVLEASTRHSLDDEPESMEDVEYFLSAKFDEIKRTHLSSRHIPHDWPSSQVKAEIVRKSSGQFIYPATIIRYITSPRHSPTMRLEMVLKLRPLSGDSPFAQLDLLYRHIILSCDDVGLALRIIGMCLLSTQTFHPPWDNLDHYGYPSEITAPEHIEKMLGLYPGDVQRGLEDLGSLIEYKGDNIQLRVLHASLFDFFSDPTRFMGLPFNLASIHTDLAIWCSYLDPHHNNIQIEDLEDGFLALFYSATVQANPTDELAQRLQHMTLPDPSLPSEGPVNSDNILYSYPKFIEYLENSAFESRNALYSHHLGLYERYLTQMLQLYERHCPGCCVLLALVSIMDQDSLRLFNWSEEFCHVGASLAISPIVHPQRWDLDDLELTQFSLELEVRPLLVSTLAPRVPKICQETALFSLRYLQSGGHSAKTRKSLEPLLKPTYFTRLKMRPWLSRFRKMRHRHSSSRYFLDEQDLHSTWWNRDDPSVDDLRPEHYIGRMDKMGVLVPLCFFSYRPEYASNYDLWYTYGYALQLLPLFLANAPPDSHLASIATNCIFSSFCTAYPQETRKAKKSIAHYLSRCRPIRAMPLGRMNTMDDMGVTQVD